MKISLKLLFKEITNVFCVSVRENNGIHWIMHLIRFFMMNKVPTKTTSLIHIRDGLGRLLYIRMNKLTLSAEEKEHLRDTLRSFMALFPKGNIPKGGSLYFMKHSDKQLTVYLEVRKLQSKTWVRTIMFFCKQTLWNPLVRIVDWERFLTP